MSTDLQLLSELEGAGAITPTSLRLPEGTSYERVEALFAYLGKLSHVTRWLIGDLICWAEGRYADKVYQAAELTGLAEGTLTNYASVCGRVAPERRREGLSFAVHAEVASLEPTQQEHWLELAEENRWTVKQLRELLRDEGLLTPRPQPAWTLDKTAAPPTATPTYEGPPAVQGAAQGGEVDGETPSPPALLTSAGMETSRFPRVLAELRDLFDSLIGMDAHGLADPATVEERRDALNWALECLAPELA